MPLPVTRKRAAKTLIDVGLRRLGDTAGGGLIKLVLLLAAPAAAAVLLAGAVVLSAANLALALLLRRGYIGTLKESLLRRPGEIESGDLRDSLSREIALEVSGEIEVPRERSPDRAGESGRPAAGPGISDPVAAAVLRLRSGDPEEIRRTLRDGALETAFLAPLALELLARDELAEDALAALRRAGKAAAGAVTDAVLDPDRDFAVRRRAVFALRSSPDPRAVAALLEGLGNRRFEIRFNCVRVLSRLRRKHPGLEIDGDRVRTALREEIESSREIRAGRRRLDPGDRFCPSLFVDEKLQDRADLSLEYLFGLLSLLADLEPLRLAFRALHTGEPRLAGTALEYLWTILPGDLRPGVLSLLESFSAPPPREREAEEARRELLVSQEEIERSLGVNR